MTASWTITQSASRKRKRRITPPFFLCISIPYLPHLLPLLPLPSRLSSRKRVISSAVSKDPLSLSIPALRATSPASPAYPRITSLNVPLSTNLRMSLSSQHERNSYSLISRSVPVLCLPGIFHRFFHKLTIRKDGYPRRTKILFHICDVNNFTYRREKKLL